VLYDQLAPLTANLALRFLSQQICVKHVFNSGKAYLMIPFSNNRKKVGPHMSMGTCTTQKVVFIEKGSVK
jgi:hypothetical protein